MHAPHPEPCTGQHTLFTVHWTWEPIWGWCALFGAMEVLGLRYHKILQCLLHDLHVERRTILEWGDMTIIAEWRERSMVSCSVIIVIVMVASISSRAFSSFFANAYNIIQ